MERHHKTKERVARKCAVRSLDDLSDDILRQILCFLETKQAIETSVLSKRWRNLWTTLPDLNFDGSDSGLFRRSQHKFPKFVLNSLVKRDDKLRVRKFSISYDRMCQFMADECLRKMGLSDEKMCQFTADECLWKMGLSDEKWYRLMADEVVDGRDYAPRHYEFLDLFGGCPNLKHLCLIECYFAKPELFKMSAPQLQSLTLDDVFNSEYKVEIYAPKLEVFRYYYRLPADLSESFLPFLQEANISAKTVPAKSKEHRKDASRNLFNMLKVLKNVNCIRLNCLSLEIEDFEVAIFPSDDNPLWEIKRYRRVETKEYRRTCKDLSSFQKEEQKYL
ncbi:hypothetical protein Tsubulata_017963, partial [Turnera subulata]